MKNIKQNTLLILSFLLLPATSLAHGSIELIECHNKNNSIILKGEALNKKNDFSFSLKKDNKEIWAHKKIQLQLTDTFENKKLIENIKIENGPNKAHIKVFEIPSREIRNGTGKVNVKALGSKSTELICYAVY